MQADYVLRALSLPKGTHSVEFKFEPDSLATFTPVNLAGSIIVVLLLLGAMAMPIVKPLLQKSKTSKKQSK